VDGEESAGGLMPVSEASVRTLKLTLAFEASPTNNVEVALGVGADGVSPRANSTVMIMGWKRGEWFVRGDRLRRQFSAPAVDPSAEGLRTLTVRMRLDPSGKPRHVAFAADGVPVLFEGLETEDLLTWLAHGWEAWQVTARGGAGNVSAEMALYSDGSVLIVK